ncbi:MAG: S1C family serine protease [Patescibacteria group bacterium]
MENNSPNLITVIGAGVVGAGITLAVLLLLARNTDLPTYLNLQTPQAVVAEPGSPIAVPVEPSMQKWDEHITGVVETVQPAVVSIAVTKDLPKYRTNNNSPFYNFFNDPFFDNFFGQPDRVQPNQPQEQEYERRQIGGGSGFLVSADGLIVTNKHVVNDKDAEYTVVTYDGTEYTARVLARDPSFDLAYLKIEADESGEFSFLEFADSDEVKLGQSVLAIGNALDEFRNTVTRGIVSGLDRRLVAGNGDGSSEVIEEAIQTDAAINPGNSGGPLLNINGQVIGVNTAVSMQGQLIGFALPSNLVKRGLEQVKQNGKLSRAWLGVRYQIINDEMIEKNNLKVDYGAIILRGADVTELAVMPGSPADKAGLRENDIILEVDGQRIDEEHSLSVQIAGKNPGETIDLKISRAGEEQLVTVALEERE